VLEVPLLFGVHAVTARASPSTVPTAKFPMKRRIPCKTPGRPRWLPCATKSLHFQSPLTRQRATRQTSHTLRPLLRPIYGDLPVREVCEVPAPGAWCAQAAKSPSSNSQPVSQ
jgi:hypothetical protein